MKKIYPLLTVADIAASLAFYRDVLGFTVTSEVPGDDGRLIHGSVSHGDADLMFGPVDAGAEPSDDAPLGTAVMLYIGVDDATDLDPFFARVKATGTRVIQEPTDEPWGDRVWGVLDPDGYRLFFLAPTADAAPKVEDRQLAGAPAD